MKTCGIKSILVYFLKYHAGYTWTLFFQPSFYDIAATVEPNLLFVFRWSIAYVNQNDLDNQDLLKPRTSTIVHNLLPYTEYLIYIKTYTTALATKGARSKIKTHRTEPGGTRICNTGMCKVFFAGEPVLLNWMIPRPSANLFQDLFLAQLQKDGNYKTKILLFFERLLAQATFFAGRSLQILVLFHISNQYGTGKPWC